MSKEAEEQRCRRCVGRKPGTLGRSKVIVKMLHSRLPTCMLAHTCGLISLESKAIWGQARLNYTVNLCLEKQK